MKQVWTIKSMIHYAEYICQGREFFNSEEGDDPHQLGGDFVHAFAVSLCAYFDTLPPSSVLGVPTDSRRHVRSNTSRSERGRRVLR